MRDDLEVRVERLERENRRLKWIGFALLILVAIVLTWQLGVGPAQPVYAQEKPLTLRAQKIELVDANGKVLAVLKKHTEGGAMFDLHDGKGDAFFSAFGYGDGGGTFYLKSKTGFLNAVANESELAIKLYAGRPRVGMSVVGKTAELFVADRNGKDVFLKTSE